VRLVRHSVFPSSSHFLSLSLHDCFDMENDPVDSRHTPLLLLLLSLSLSLAFFLSLSFSFSLSILFFSLSVYLFTIDLA